LGQGYSFPGNGRWLRRSLSQEGFSLILFFGPLLLALRFLLKFWANKIFTFLGQFFPLPKFLNSFFKFLWTPSSGLVFTIVVIEEFLFEWTALFILLRGLKQFGEFIGTTLFQGLILKVWAMGVLPEHFGWIGQVVRQFHYFLGNPD